MHLSLSLIDDSPRQDFAPRQRHALKEFAAVVMHEMELWRDKIQLRIRDKIQTSVSTVCLNTIRPTLTHRVSDGTI
ncbi:hypothetical protein P692DRAFT_20288895 [Suillus brevipes Sb2]|nr:hypothetical protein P692DRAFT_20288895 [Suillus brevipes Sb2]